MTPVHFNRLKTFASQINTNIRSGNLITSVILKVKTIAILIIPLIALFFLYLTLSDPKGENATIFKATSFNQLKLSKDHKKSIEFVLKNLAMQKKRWLWDNSTIMNYHGDRIEIVHPLKFLSHVLSDKKLKDFYLKPIFNDSFKRISFMRGLTNSFKKMHNYNAIEPYLDGFMYSLSIPTSKKENLKSYIKNNDWNGFFYFVRDNSKTQKSWF
jgi:hypothetical protein